MTAPSTVLPASKIPGPGVIGSARRLQSFFDDPTAFYCGLRDEWGDLVRTKIGKFDMVTCFDLDAINQMLIPDAACVRKGSGIRATIPVLGQGLFTSEGEYHARCRRQVQPAFQPRNLAPLDTTMTTCVDKQLASWTDGAHVNAHREMTAITLDIAAETLFGITLDRQGLVDFGTAVGELNAAYIWMVGPGGELMQKLPLPRTRRLNAGVRHIDDMVERIIAARRDGQRREVRDLLTLLLEATGDGGERFSDRELRDHAVTLLVTAHETISGALGWVFAVLGTRPDIQAKVIDEVDRVCAGATPTYEHTRELPYLKAAISETMRLYPTSYGFVREPVDEPYELMGYEIHPGTDIGVPTAAIHRDPRLYDDPLELRPERFIDDNPLRRHRLAYMPFGAGSRICIGSSFAWIEMMLVVARITQSWTVEATDPATALEPQAVFTMFPKNGPEVRLTAR